MTSSLVGDTMMHCGSWDSLKELLARPSLQEGLGGTLQKGLEEEVRERGEEVERRELAEGIKAGLPLTVPEHNHVTDVSLLQNTLFKIGIWMFYRPNRFKFIQLRDFFFILLIFK